MMQSMREGAQSKLIKGLFLFLLTLAVAGLMLTDVGGFFRGGVGRNDVVSIDGTRIPAQRFDRSVRRVIARQGVTPDQAYQLGLIDRILNEEITNVLYMKAAAKYGIQISNELVAREIKDIITPLITENNDAASALNGILRAQGMSEGEFADSIRSGMVRTIFRNAFGSSDTALVPDIETRLIYSFTNEERVVDYIDAPNTNLKLDTQPTPDELKSYYQTIKNQFIVPELRSIDLVVFGEDSLKHELEVDDETVLSVYEADIDLYTTPPQRRIDQAIFETQNDAAQVTEAVKGGENFEAAVKRIAGDDAWLGEQSVAEDGLVDAVAKAVFAADIGALTDPVQTALGWHVVKVHEDLPESVKPYDAVKEEIKAFLLRDLLADQLINLANTVDDRLAGGEALGDVAADLQFDVRTLGPMTISGRSVEGEDLLGEFEDDRSYLLETVFELFEGDASPVLQLSNGKMAVLSVQKIIPQSIRAYEEVESDVKSSWIANEQRLQNKTRVEALRAKIASGEMDLSGAAKELGLGVKTTRMKRSEVSDTLSAQVQVPLFNADIDQIITAPYESGFVLGKVTEIDWPDAAQADAETVQELERSLVSAFENESFLAFTQDLYANSRVNVNDGLISMMYAPGSDGEASF